MTAATKTTQKPGAEDCCVAWAADYKSRNLEAHPKRFGKKAKSEGEGDVARET